MYTGREMGADPCWMAEKRGRRHVLREKIPRTGWGGAQAGVCVEFFYPAAHIWYTWQVLGDDGRNC